MPAKYTVFVERNALCIRPDSYPCVITSVPAVYDQAGRRFDHWEDPAGNKYTTIWPHKIQPGWVAVFVMPIAKAEGEQG
jgi:hypothetical protein